jgi:hypothetical protein
MNVAIGSRTQDYITSGYFLYTVCLVIFDKGLGLGGEIPEIQHFLDNFSIQKLSIHKKCGMWNTKVVGCSGFCVGWQNLWDDQCISRWAELGHCGHTAGCPQTINGMTSLSRHMNYIKNYAFPSPTGQLGESCPEMAGHVIGSGAGVCGTCSRTARVAS